MKAIKVRITGRVQGVWYRGWTKDQADKLGIVGWVRNRDDGSVEALFKADEEVLDQMLTLAHKGPPAAKVEHIEVTEAQGICPNRFDVKPTV